jgi:hypothetical protein
MHPEVCDANISTSWDNETVDEMRYDTNAVSKMMDFIYDSTKNNPLFQVIYDLAAAKMMSLDREIGLCVLFSYDHLLYFHQCLVEYMKNPDDFNSENEVYILIKNRLK